MAIALCLLDPRIGKKYIDRLCERRAAMAVTKKTNTTADGDPQETKVGGNDVTVKHDSSESLVTVALQTKADVAKQVTVVVVNFNGNEEKHNCSHTEEETPRSPPKTNPWNEFQKQHRGSQLTREQLSALYWRTKKQHESLTTHGS